MSTFTISGDLRFEHRIFKKIRENNVAQIDLFADAKYDGCELKDVKFLTLEIEGTVGERWVVDDQSPRFLPYLKPVAGYRKYLILQLQRILTELPEFSQRSASCPLWMGINTYISELKTFNELRSLTGQLRQSVESLQRHVKNNPSHEAPARKKLNKMFEILDVVPATNRSFEAI